MSLAFKYFQIFFVQCLVFGLLLFACKTEKKESGGGDNSNKKVEAADRSPDGDQTPSDRTGDRRTRGKGQLDEEIGDGDGKELRAGPGKYDANYAKSRNFFRVNKTALVQSRHPNAKNAFIYYSTNIKELIKNEIYSIPEGSVAIKEFEVDSKKIVTAMIKKKSGYNKKSNDWYFMEIDYDNDKVLEEGKSLDGCIKCHSDYSDTDFLAYAKQAERILANSDEDHDLQGGGGNTPGKFVADFQSSDQFFTSMTSYKRGISPHGDVWIYYSGNLRNYISQVNFVVPNGSVAIKKFKKDTTSPVKIAVMIKQSNAWVYEQWQYDAWNDLKRETIDQNACKTCHEDRNKSWNPGKDGLAGTQFR